MRPRLALAYEPEWTKEIEGCAYNMTRKYWNGLKAWYEWDDLMQEARIAFLRLQRRYRGKVDNPAWFMSLFKVSWQRRLIHLFRRRPAYSLSADPLPELVEPPELQDLLELIDSIPMELRIMMADLCRPIPRFRFSKKDAAPLKSLLTTRSAHGS